MEQSQRTGVADPLAAKAPITWYRDYKLPLKSELVTEPSKVRRFWKMTRHAARQLELHVRKRPKPLEPRHRRVFYFDTPALDLHRSGFILRQRTFLKDGVPAPNHELTLKFRDADYATVVTMDLRPALPCTHAIKFKEQVITEFRQMRGMRVMYSLNCELQTADTIWTQNLDQLLRLFPFLGRIGIQPGATLQIVNHIAIEEVLLNLGEIDFARHIAKPALAIWLDRATGNSLVAEYSYRFKLRDPESFRGHPQELSDALFLKLQTEAADWLCPGTTKTMVVYGLHGLRSSQGQAITQERNVE